MNKMAFDEYKRQKPWLTKQNKPSLTQQEPKNDVDINTVVQKVRKGTIVLPEVSEGLVADFTTVGSFHECLLSIEQAKREFMSLPAKLRYKFGNDPGALLDWLADPENRKEAMEIGLLKKNETASKKEVKASEVPEGQKTDETDYKKLYMSTKQRLDEMKAIWERPNV